MTLCRERTRVAAERLCSCVPGKAGVACRAHLPCMMHAPSMHEELAAKITARGSRSLVYPTLELLVVYVNYHPIENGHLSLPRTASFCVRLCPPLCCTACDIQRRWFHDILPCPPPSPMAIMIMMVMLQVLPRAGLPKVQSGQQLHAACGTG